MKRASSSSSSRGAMSRREYMALCALLIVSAACLLPFSPLALHHLLFINGVHVVSPIRPLHIHLVKEPHAHYNRPFSHAHPQNFLKLADSSESSVQVKGINQARYCNKSMALLKVFMYDLPSELHFGMIEPTSVEAGHTWPTNLTGIVPYPGGLYQQHSPEYWLTLDLLRSSEEAEEVAAYATNYRTQFDKACGKHLKKGHAANIVQVNDKSKLKGSTDVFDQNHDKGHELGSLISKVGTKRPCGALRVRNAKDADVYFVPFFASLSYNRYTRMGMRGKDVELQKKVIDYVMSQDAWKRSKGRDHVIVMHHPNSLSMARDLLGEATFIVADFGRVLLNFSYAGKDIVAPYKHVIPTFHGDESSFQSRPILLFFQGAIHRKEGGFIRKQLYNLIKNEKGVVFRHGSFSSVSMKSATEGMRSAKFCLHLAGDTPSSNRLFDAIVSHCVPVIVSKDIELPYEDMLDYSKFCIFVDHEDALRKGFLIKFLRSIGRGEWTRMWKRLKEVQVHFEYQFPSQEGDATQMVWKSLANKVPRIKQKLHKLKRFSRSQHS